ncbi:MAG: uroporphyrinogen-III C-methyltransferase [Gammaproteobacteria bacterium]|nr:uroporphyrinogen-III C-methyltransferase [Gammaproteobacteria bacterium]
MTEVTDQAAQMPAAEPAAIPQRKPGRMLPAFGFLLAVGALAGVGYLYFLLVYLDPSAGLAADMAQAASERDALRAELRQLEERQGLADERLRRLDEGQGQSQAEWAAQADEWLTAADSGLARRLDQLAQAAPPSEREWKLAEVEYLLRVANHRLLMEQDVPTALGLLQAADGIVEALDDLVLHPVRAALANEMLALSKSEGADVQGLYLRLEALKRQLGSLALARPQHRLAELEEAPSEPDGILEAVAAEFRQLLRFRRMDAAVKPLLVPEEAVYLELNLRLMLEQAQLAALKRDQVVFDSSLGSAQEWVRKHLDLDDPDVQFTLEALAGLRQVEIDVPLPDLSGSLNALTQVRQAPT